MKFEIEVIGDVANITICGKTIKLERERGDGYVGTRMFTFGLPDPSPGRTFVEEHVSDFARKFMAFAHLTNEARSWELYYGDDDEIEEKMDEVRDL